MSKYAREISCFIFEKKMRGFFLPPIKKLYEGVCVEMTIVCVHKNPNRNVGVVLQWYPPKYWFQPLNYIDDLRL